MIALWLSIMSFLVKTVTFSCSDLCLWEIQGLTFTWPPNIWPKHTNSSDNLSAGGHSNKQTALLALLLLAFALGLSPGGLHLVPLGKSFSIQSSKTQREVNSEQAVYLSWWVEWQRWRRLFYGRIQLLSTPQFMPFQSCFSSINLFLKHIYISKYAQSLDMFVTVFSHWHWRVNTLPQTDMPLCVASPCVDGALSFHMTEPLTAFDSLLLLWCCYVLFIAFYNFCWVFVNMVKPCCWHGWRRKHFATLQLCSSMQPIVKTLHNMQHIHKDSVNCPVWHSVYKQGSSVLWSPQIEISLSIHSCSIFSIC